MKKIVLSLTLVGSLFAFNADLNAFTAVTSGAWSNAATWGGVGPGSTVSNQDIIIPAGITVDMDMDITFNGLLNQFQTNGTLMNTADHWMSVQNGTFSGTGAVMIHKLEISGLITTYSFTGALTTDVFRNNTTAVSFTSVIAVADTLDLESGITNINAGADLQLAAGSVVRVNDGSLVNNGGMLTIGGPYHVWYFGSTKTAGVELDSMWVQDLYLALDNNTQNILLSGNTMVRGTLHMQVGHLLLNGNHLTIDGDYWAASNSIIEPTAASGLEIGGSGADLTNGLIFPTGAVIGKLTVSRDTFAVWLMSDLTIADSLILEEGSLEVDTNATLTMLANSEIVREYGWIEMWGTFDGTQLYNVAYTGNESYSGAELWGSGLNNLRVELDYTVSVVHLTQDLTVPGHLDLVMGEFDLNDSDLVVNGTFDQNSDAPIRGTLQSSITLAMTTSVNDSLFVRQAFYQIEELIIDLPTGSMVTLGGNLFTTKLTLNSGKVDVGNYILKIGSANPVITGATDTNYVAISGYGWLQMFVSGNDPYLMFPIGTPTEFTPVEIRQVGSTAQHNGYFSVRVREGVWTNGYTGTDVSSSQSVVNKTWEVLADSGVTMNYDLRLGWGVLSEVNGFDRQNSFVKNYYNNMWDSELAMPAATGPDNTFTRERMGMQNDGYFAVVDNNSPLVVEEPSADGYSVYPNPSADVVNVQISNPDNSVFQYELFDAAGRKVLGTQNSNTLNQFDLRSFENGAYTMRVTNLSTNEVVTRLIVKS